MSTDFWLKRFDTAPPLDAQLLDSLSAPVDLTGATLHFYGKPHGGGSLVITGVATILSAASGTVRYNWASGDTGIAGDYDCEFEAIFPGGKKQSFPNPGFIVLTISPDVDGA